MVLKSRLYPYPVLYKHGDDYVDGDFDIEVELSKSKKHIDFNFNVSLNEDQLLNLIYDGKAIFAVHIECSHTSYRKLFVFKDSIYNIRVNANKVNGNVEICSFILTTEKIINYYSDNFNDDYTGVNFNIEKHNVLAIGSSYKIEIEKDEDALRNIQSIFIVVREDDERANTIVSSYNDDYISIKIPAKQYSDYKSMGSIPQNYPTIHSILLVPVLVEIFEKMRNEDFWFNNDDRKWFKAIKKAAEKKGVTLDISTIDDINSFNLAQELIDSPILKVFDGFSSFMNIGDDDL